jgi:hypothetical protein
VLEADEELIGEITAFIDPSFFSDVRVAVAVCRLKTPTALVPTGERRVAQ